MFFKASKVLLMLTGKAVVWPEGLQQPGFAGALQNQPLKTKQRDFSWFFFFVLVEYFK